MMLSKYIVDELSLFTQEEFYIFIGLLTGFFLSTFACILVDFLIFRDSKKRLEVLERIILDKSKVIITTHEEEYFDKGDEE